MPRVSQVVPVSVSHCDEGLDGINVLLLHLGDACARREQGEASQSLHICISLQLEPANRTVFSMCTERIHREVNGKQA